MEKVKKIGKDDGFWRFDDPFIYQVRTNGVQYTKTELRKHTIDWLVMNLGVGRRRLAMVDRNPGSTMHVTNSLLSNYAWYQMGRPYCKIGPNMAAMMGRTKFSIPKDKVHMPFPTFEIRFPAGKSNPMHDGKGGPPLRALKVNSVFKFDEHEIALFDHDTYMNLVLDFGDMINDGENNYRYYHFFNLEMKSPGTMEDAFQRTMAQGGPSLDGGYRPTDEFIRRILSVVICTTFFMTNQHEMVCPDIPRRDVERYRRLSSSRRPEDVRQLRDLMDKLKDMDHFGYMIREYELPRPNIHYNYTNDGRGEGTGMQLEWSHVRGAHGAWRWVGPRSNPDLKWVFIQPTLVRPDLPFNPNRVIGYRVNDHHP